MLKTPDVFIKKYDGTSINIDGAAGLQCVDGFKIFLKWIGAPIIATGTGWAEGYWTSAATEKKLDPYFNRITVKADLQPGDWLVWDKDSSCPKSHIGMFVRFADAKKTEAYVFSMGSGRGFETRENDLDILGALRWKAWDDQTGTEIKARYPAYNFTKSTAGTYTTKVELNIRDGAGMNYKIIGVMPKGSTFTTYGYHTGAWYYGIYKKGKTKITGFAHSYNLERKKK